MALPHWRLRFALSNTLYPGQFMVPSCSELDRAYIGYVELRCN